MGIKTGGVALILAWLVAMPAAAQDLLEVDPGDDARGWYIGGAGGANFVDQLDLNIGGTQADIDVDPGWAISGSAGYGFESGIRLEAEVSYRDNRIDDIAINGIDQGGTGALNTLTIMGNVLLDWRNSTRFTPYIGAGLGAAWVDGDISIGANQILEDQDWGWAAQGIAGVSVLLTENVSLTLDYRFLQTFDTNLSNAAATNTMEDNVDNHMIMAGLRYTFADPEPPPPAPAPPPQQEVSQVPANTTFLVFFDWDSARLSSEANGVLDEVVVVYNADGFAQVFVDGHADRSGPAAYNIGLSERRAEAVRQGLVARGIAPDEIVVRAFGESEPLVPTADGVREPQNRRVEIILA